MEWGNAWHMSTCDTLLLAGELGEGAPCSIAQNRSQKTSVAQTTMTSQPANQAHPTPYPPLRNETKKQPKPWGPKAHWLVSPDVLPLATCAIFPTRYREKGAFKEKPSKRGIFPSSRGKNRMSQGVGHRGSLLSVLPLALRGDREETKGSLVVL